MFCPDRIRDKKFLPPNLAVTQMGVTNSTAATDNATRPQADIDLYVSTSPGLTNLDPAVLLGAFAMLLGGPSMTSAWSGGKSRRSLE